MSKCKHKHHHENVSCGGYGFKDLFTIIILILIVLQWFRVGSNIPGGVGGVGGVGGPGGPGYPESGLMSNGGLFIIALFILIACACFKGMEPMEHKKHHC